MKKETGNRIKRIMASAGAFIACASMTFGAVNVTFAEETDGGGQNLQSENDTQKAERTIMLYDCGSNLETDAGMATYNLHQILNASFSKDDKIRFVVMTGGADQWHTESSYLYDPATGTSPIDISGEYNQIWEAKGQDAAENPGKLVLLDGDGLSGDGEDAKPSSQELMSDPKTLKSFIDYSVENFPADKYDLILWDHGGGPNSGFGNDQHDGLDGYLSMSFAGLVDAFSDNAVTREGKRFDFIDFDACLMSSVEQLVAFADYTDYYIASPETEPGYGQDYSGWLNRLGEDHYTDTFTLGKIIVDDFLAFYDKEEGDGSTQEGTLAVIDMQKLMDKGFVSLLNEFNVILNNEITTPGSGGEYLFYDELFSGVNSLRYGSIFNYFDFGNLLALMSFLNKEATPDDVTDKSHVNDTNAYTRNAEALLSLINDPELIYAGGTEGIRTDYKLFRDTDGKITFDMMKTSGLYIYFSNAEIPANVKEYYGAVENVIPLVKNEERRAFLEDYVQNMINIALIDVAGNTVSFLVDSGTDKDEIDYEKVKDRWIHSDEEYMASMWFNTIEPFYAHLDGGEDAAVTWLDGLIKQQASETVSRENVSAYEIERQNGSGYRILINDTAKRAIDSIRFNLIAELPAVKAYLDDPENLMIKMLMEAVPGLEAFKIGSVPGVLDLSMDSVPESGEGFLAQYIKWYNDPAGLWAFDAIEDKWYALQDADGYNHVVTAEGGEEKTEALVTYSTEKGQQPAILTFAKDGYLSQITMVKDGTLVSIPVSELKTEMSFMPVQYVDVFGFFQFFLPMSASPVVVNPQTAGSIKVIYTDVSNIPDIQDTDGDGEVLRKQAVIRDIYGYEYDISEKVKNPEGHLKSIRLAQVETALYNGKVQRPQLTLDGETLTEGKDYDIANITESEFFKEVGKYEIVVMGTGDYSDMFLTTFVIEQASVNDADVSGIEDMTYTGAPLEQEIQLTLGDLVLEEGYDYTVSYKDNVDVGTATMVIEGINNFTGSVTLTFEIKPEETTSPADLTDPPESVEPAEPTDPTEPTGSTYPTESREPTEPTGYTDPTGSREPGEPTGTKDPANPSGKGKTPANTGREASPGKVIAAQKTSKAASVKTGDNNYMPVFIAIAAAGAAGITAAVAARRRRKEK